MAEAIAIAANPAAPAAKQIKDHDNDEDRSKRHGVPPQKGGWRTFRPPTASEEQHIQPAGSSRGTRFSGLRGEGYFGSSFSAAELMQ
jgi:hypothetical protein